MGCAGLCADLLKLADIVSVERLQFVCRGLCDLRPTGVPYLSFEFIRVRGVASDAGSIAEVERLWLVDGLDFSSFVGSDGLERESERILEVEDTFIRLEGSIVGDW